jgi:hypothetical protein
MPEDVIREIESIDSAANVTRVPIDV